MQQFLKPARGAAWAGVVAPEFFDQFLVAVDEAGDLAAGALDARFGRVAFLALGGRFEITCGLETSWRRGVVLCVS
jgi:hypothetical protein